MRISKANPILDLCHYVVKFEYGTKAELVANAITQIMYAQCDHDVNQ